MPLLRADPNYYAARAPREASTTGVTALDLGFPAVALHVDNQSAADVYVNPQSTAVCTSADLCIRACSYQLLAPLPPFSHLTLWASSTGATAQDFGIAALGG